MNISHKINIDYGIYHIQCPVSFFLLFVFFVIFISFFFGGVYRDLYQRMKAKYVMHYMQRAIAFYSQGLIAFLFQNKKKALHYVQKGKQQKMDIALGDIIEFFIQYSDTIYGQHGHQSAAKYSCICSISKYNFQDNGPDVEYFISRLTKKYPRVKIIREIDLMHCLKNKQYGRALFLLKKEHFIPVLDVKKRNAFTAFIFLERAKSFLHAQDTKRAINYAWKSFKINPCQHNTQTLFDFFIQQENSKDAERLIVQAYNVIQDKEFILSLYQKILENDSPFVQLKKIKALLQKQNHIADSARILAAKIALKAGMWGEARFQLQQQNNIKNPITYLLMAKLDRQEGISQDSYWLDQIESCLDAH